MKKQLTICVLMSAIVAMGITLEAKTTKKARKGKSRTSQTTKRKTQNNSYINGHFAIDLGLSVRWAETNISANTQYLTGHWFAWRDYDVARNEWGGSWRIPTMNEWRELVNKCYWTWTGNGYQVTGPNGNHIFLPLTGRMVQGQCTCSNLGFYWTSQNTGNGSDAYAFRFWNGGKDFIQQNYYWCIPIRPVTR